MDRCAPSNCLHPIACRGLLSVSVASFGWLAGCWLGWEGARLVVRPKIATLPIRTSRGRWLVVSGWRGWRCWHRWQCWQAGTRSSIGWLRVSNKQLGWAGGRLCTCGTGQRSAVRIYASPSSRCSQPASVRLESHCQRHGWGRRKKKAGWRPRATQMGGAARLASRRDRGLARCRTASATTSL